MPDEKMKYPLLEFEYDKKLSRNISEPCSVRPPRCKGEPFHRNLKKNGESYPAFSIFPVLF